MISTAFMIWLYSTALAELQDQQFWQAMNTDMTRKCSGYRKPCKLKYCAELEAEQ